jgi:DNA polymerase III sliding clamp (beta) subunit (PCNA family)
MKVSKKELASKIDQLKPIVPKRSTIEALEGILVDNGYLIASNQETTVRAKLEGMEGTFVIPSKAFDLIKSLPDGDIDIEVTGSKIVFKTGKIRNSFGIPNKDMFNYTNFPDVSDTSIKVQWLALLPQIRSTLYAVGNVGDQRMQSIYLQVKDGSFNAVGLDGHRIAWNRMSLEGNMSALIKRECIEKLIGFNLDGPVTICTTNTAALFVNDEYEISTRLVDGTYYDYGKMYECKPELIIEINRSALQEAISRAKLVSSDNVPVIFDIADDGITIQLNDSESEYSESIALEHIEGTKPFRIAFSSKYLIEAFKTFSRENLTIEFTNAKGPAIITETGTELKALVLPVNIRK